MEQHLFNLTASETRVEPGRELATVVSPNLWLLSSEDIPPILFTAEEVGRLLRISKSRVYMLLREQELRSVKVGGSRRITARAVRDYVEGLSVGEFT